jgi:hypothetical protein
MQFRVIERSEIPVPAPTTAYLVTDRWDDWGKYRTQFSLILYDHNAVRHDPGSVKIGQEGLLPSSTVEPGKRAPTLPPVFHQLDDQFFSLGQGDTYYEELNQLPEDLRLATLKGLNDVAFNTELFEKFRDQEVMKESLTRYIEETNIRNRFHRLAHGNSALTRFAFNYILPPVGNNTPTISFEVEPQSQPPTNVHVLIGRNGVGKTRSLQALSMAVASAMPNPVVDGFIVAGPDRRNWDFAGVVVVTFSAFDQFQAPTHVRPGIRFAMVGLKDAREHQVLNPEAQVESFLAPYFSASLVSCRHGLRRDRFISAIRTLESDPLFAEAAVADLLDLPDHDWMNSAESLFKSLSSGHAIVLLTITRLVELADERTFVLLDEPEAHLHPPLLSAFVRALSELLINRNGFALIATHSPVVLQEVPKSCVWMLRRSGRVSNAERPSLETFGENVGVLTREVFGLEVTNSGFHQMLKAAVNRGLTFDEVIQHFDGQLGAEAQGIVRSLIAARNQKQ